jgi:hypothetical protein
MRRGKWHSGRCDGDGHHPASTRAIRDTPVAATSPPSATSGRGQRAASRRDVSRPVGPWSEEDNSAATRSTASVRSGPCFSHFQSLGFTLGLGSDTLAARSNEGIPFPLLPERGMLVQRTAIGRCRVSQDGREVASMCRDDFPLAVRSAAHVQWPTRLGRSASPRAHFRRNRGNRARQAESMGNPSMGPLCRHDSGGTCAFW